MNEFLQFSHVSKQPEIPHSKLISILTVLGIVFLVSAVFQEANRAFAQTGSDVPQGAKIVEK